jgi:hypothetical protein
MNKKFAIFILISVLFLLLGRNESFAEWASPGKLAKAHKELDGIDNCMKCHSLVKGITDAACKACHEKLIKRINAKKGFHSNIKAKCHECHTDHKGEKHDIVWIDKENFDHNMTGYTLQDKHNVPCKDCHKQKNTFLDLPSDKCLNCHIDVHKKTAPEDCIICHDFKGWKVPKYDHPTRSDYQVTGKHAEVKCEPCHYLDPVREKDTRTDKIFRVIKFKPRDHKKCDDCHFDIHMGQFTKQGCIECHLLKQDWKDITFRHESSKYMGYKLDNKHKDVACDKCHERSEIRFKEFGNEKKAFTGLFKPIESKKCNDCHYDVHMAQFTKQDCAGCHPVNNDWKDITFRHDSPDYPGYKLLGKHNETLCDKCHKRSEVIYTEFKKERKALAAEYKPIKSDNCKDCHKDGHKGKYKEIAQFKNKTCEHCHTIETGWKVRSYEHVPESKYYKYTLRGQIKESKCESCHICSSDIFCITCCFENNFR